MAAMKLAEHPTREDQPGGDISKPSDVPDLIMPSPKSCMRRLKYIGGVFRRLLLRASKRQPGGKAVDSAKHSSSAGDEPTEEMSQTLHSVKSPDVPAQAVGAIARHPRNRKDVLKHEGSAEALSLPLDLSQELQLHALGQVRKETPGFQASTDAVPVGYKAVRIHASFMLPGTVTKYAMEVLDAGSQGLAFQVTAADCPNEPVKETSASAAWTEVFRRIHKLNGSTHTVRWMPSSLC